MRRKWLNRGGEVNANDAMNLGNLKFKHLNPKEDSVFDGYSGLGNNGMLSYSSLVL